MRSPRAAVRPARGSALLPLPVVAVGLLGAVALLVLVVVAGLRREPSYLLPSAAAVLAMIALGSLVRGLVLSRREVRRQDRERSEAELMAQRLLRIGEEMSGALSLSQVAQGTAALAHQGTGSAGAWVRLGADLGGREASAGDAVHADFALRCHRRSDHDGQALFSDATVGEVPATSFRSPHAVLPIRSDSELLGHLVVMDPRRAAWTAQDIRYLTSLAGHTALALSRAIAYETVAAASATLQASIRPDSHHALPGLRLHSAYRPGSSGHHVGGDWFDSVAVDEDHTVLVIGDVMGKGWRAAAVMGQVRTALRAAALMHLDPAEALDLLDRGVVDLGMDEIVTVLYAVVDRRRGRLGVARAGHPPALVLDEQGVARFLEPGGSPPIGVPAGAREEWWVPAEEVTGIVLYTDGVVETRTSDLDQGMASLAADVTDVAARAGSEGEAVWDTWLEDLQARTDWQDDVAVMVGLLGTLPASEETEAAPTAGASSRQRGTPSSR